MADPLTHERVPNHRVLTKAQAAVVLRREKVDDIENVPFILFSDPVLAALRLEGKQMEIGDLVEINRSSLTTIKKLSWRVIVSE